MEYVLDLPVVYGKNGLFVCVDRYSKFCCPNPIFVGEGALSAK